jgi:prepilin peptidase CpaA
MITIVEIALLMVLVSIAMVVDMRERRIPNTLIGFGLLVGIVFLGLQWGTIPVFDRIGAFFIGIAILIIPFAMGGIGAGDVKLLGLIGLFVGIKTLINISLVAFVTGGAIALVTIMLSRFHQFKNLRTVVLSFINAIMTRRLLLAEEGKISLPFSIPIGIGTFIVLILKWSIF